MEIERGWSVRENRGNYSFKILNLNLNGITIDINAFNKILYK